MCRAYGFRAWGLDFKLVSLSPKPQIGLGFRFRGILKFWPHGMTKLPVLLHSTQVRSCCELGVFWLRFPFRGYFVVDSCCGV